MRVAVRAGGREPFSSRECAGRLIPSSDARLLPPHDSRSRRDDSRDRARGDTPSADRRRTARRVRERFQGVRHRARGNGTILATDLERREDQSIEGVGQ